MKRFKGFLVEISIFSIIFLISILYLLSNDFLNISRPYFVYETLIVIPITYLFGATVGAFFLLIVLSFDAINHIGVIYFHNLVDVYKNFQFFFSHSYAWFYYLLQAVVIFLCYCFYRLVKNIEKRRLRNLSLFFFCLLLIIFSVDNFLSKQERFKSFLQTNEILVTGLKNISNSLILSIYKDAKQYKDIKQYIEVNENYSNIILPGSKSFFYPSLKSYKNEELKEKKNVVLIIIESLGYAHDPAVQEFLLEPLNDIRLNKKFHISSSKLEALEGSTVTAEFRELCGIKYGNYNKIHEDFMCAPKIFYELGYSTLAAHPYIGGYFNRRIWWKEIGFKETYFMKNIKNEDFKKCYGSYESFCDNQFFSRTLEEASYIKTPFFLYYLSIEGHLPTKLASEEDYINCIFKLKRNRVFCGNLLINKSLIETIVKVIIDLELENTDFYLVGDHVPKFVLSQNLNVLEANNVQTVSLISKTRE